MNSQRKNWKERLDNFLVLNLFIVIIGALLFLVGVVGKWNGSESLLHLFQKLWYPLFIPAFSLFFTAILIEACINWFNREDDS